MNEDTERNEDRLEPETSLPPDSANERDESTLPNKALSDQLDDAMASPAEDRDDSDDGDDAGLFGPDDTPEQKREKRAQLVVEFKPRVLAHVNEPGYRPSRPKEIARALKIDGRLKKLVKRAIYHLVREGVLTWGENHEVRLASPTTANRRPKPVREAKAAPSPVDRSDRFAKPERSDSKSKKGLVTGVIRKTSAGAGFVRPLDATKDHQREHDLFVPQSSAMDASDGDIVKVRLERASDGRFGRPGRVVAHVVEIVERRTNQFVGTYNERDRQGWVTIDGKAFADPVLVGDAGAKNLAPGDKVVVEMVRFPSPRSAGQAVVVEILGAKGQPGVDTLSIIREYDLPTEFPDDVLEDARRQADAFDESFGDRADFTGETVITIDPVDARDFDDAISMRTLPGGHWELGVHIADVSHFVKPKSPLDREALDRATSVYLPDRVLPMLPEVISNHLASLQPDRVRYTQSCFIEFTPDGVPVHAEVKRGAIRSCRRFAYEEVDEFLADKKPWRETLDPKVFALIESMHELAMILRKRRLARGALELTLPKTKIELNKEGQVCGARLEKNTVSHQIIEEFMLAANEAVARILDARNLPFLRRVHEPPNPRKLDLLTSFVRELGIKSEPLHSRHEIKKVVASVADTTRMHAVNYAVLRSMQKAAYSPTKEGHYALNSENYCHFTSPIRRYPDLTIHRMLETIERGGKVAAKFDEQAILGEHCSDRERRAEEAERELTKIKLLTYLESRVGETMTGVVTGVEDFGFFVQGTDLPAEGLVHVRTLQGDRWRFERGAHRLVGYREGNSFRLGDQVEVEIAFVDVDRRALDLRFVRKLAEGDETPTIDAREFSPTGKNRKPDRSPQRGKQAKGAKTFGGKRSAAKADRKYAAPRKKSRSNEQSAAPPKPPKKKKSRPGKREREAKKKGPGQG